MRNLTILFLCTGLVAQSYNCTEILNQYTDNASHWYGIGTSKMKRVNNSRAVDSATKQALENLSSKLNTRIESAASIITKETIGTKRSKFFQKSSSKTQTFTSQNISDYTVEFSSPCNKKQHLVVLSLNKDIFFRNQEQKITGLLVQIDNMMNGVDAYQNRLNKLDEYYNELIMIGRIEGMDENISLQYSQAIGEIISEYDKLISDLSIEILLNEPLMYHVDNNPNVILKTYQLSNGKPVPGLKINKGFFKGSVTNQNGEVSKKWSEISVDKLPLQINTELSLYNLVGSHSLYDEDLFINPTAFLNVDKEPLQLKVLYNISDDFFLNKVDELTNITFQILNEKMKVTKTTDINSPFVVEINYQQLVRISNKIKTSDEPIEVFKVEFNPVITLKNTSTNKNLMYKDLGVFEATSYRSFESAYKKAAKDLPILFKEIGEQIVEVIL